MYTDKKEVSNGFLTPPVVHNDAAVTKVVKSVTEKFATVVTPEVTLGAEDFANYMEHVQDVSSLLEQVARMNGITQHS